MTKQYVDLLNTVHIDIWEDDKTWAKKKHGQILAMKILSIVLCILGIIFMLLRRVVFLLGIPLGTPLKVCEYTSWIVCI